MRAGGLLLLVFGGLGTLGLWHGLPAPVLLLGMAWLPGHVALQVCPGACVRGGHASPWAGPGGLAFALAFSLVLVTAAVLPLFLLHDDLSAAASTLGIVYVLLGVTAVAFPGGASGGDAYDWLAWAGAVALLLPMVVRYAGGTVDDWWDLAFVRAYAAADNLTFAEPVLGTGRTHPRFSWNAWLVLQALVVRFSAIDPFVLQVRYLAAFVCVVSVAAVAALARAVFGAERRTAQAAAVLFVPAWLYGTEALPYFTRLHQDKFVAALVLVPVLLASAVSYLRDGRSRFLVVTGVAALAVALVHGVLYAVGLVGVAACVLAILLGPGPPRRRGLPRAVALLGVLAIAAAYPVWQGWTVREWFEAQGIVLGAADNPVVRAHLWLERLLWPNSVAMIVNPAAVFGPAVVVAVVGLVGAARHRREPAARVLMYLTLVPCLLIFVPLIARAAGSVLIPWMLYRLGWLVPLPLLAGFAFERALAVDGRRRRQAAVLALVLGVIVSSVPQGADRLRRGMREHPVDREKAPRGTTREVYRQLARAADRRPVLAPMGLSQLIPALTGRSTVAISERGTLVFAGDERAAYERMRDRARFFVAEASSAERGRIASRYRIGAAVFRRRLVTSGSEARWLSYSSAEGFARAVAASGSLTWSHDPAVVAAALPADWRVVLVNRDFVVAQAPPSARAPIPASAAAPGGGGAWLAAFDVDPADVRSAGTAVLASMVGYPAAAVAFDPVPLSLGISDRPVWMGARLHWEDGPSEVDIRLALATPCRVSGVEVVPFLPYERREVFEITVGDTVRRLRARDGEPLHVALPAQMRATTTVRVRSMFGLAFGLADVRVWGDRRTCRGGWSPQARPRLLDAEVPLAELAALADAYPRTAKASVGVARWAAEAGRVADAHALLRSALHSDPSATGVWVELGLVRDEAGLADEAYDAYRQAVRTDSNSAWARGCLAWAELRRKNLAAALYHGWRAVMLDARYADAYTILANAVERLGARSYAERLLEHAVGLDPRRNWAYLELARLLHEQGRTRDALELLGDLLELVPDDEYAQDMVARLKRSTREYS